MKFNKRERWKEYTWITVIMMMMMTIQRPSPSLPWMFFLVLCSTLSYGSSSAPDNNAMQWVPGCGNFFKKKDETLLCVTDVCTNCYFRDREILAKKERRILLLKWREMDVSCDPCQLLRERLFACFYMTWLLCLLCVSSTKSACVICMPWILKYCQSLPFQFAIYTCEPPVWLKS